MHTMEATHHELQARLERRERELRAVYRITSALSARTDLDEMERQTLLTAIETVDASAGSILLHDPQHHTLVFKYVVGASPEITAALTGMEMPDTKGIAGQVFQSGMGRISEDVSAEGDHDRGIGEQVNYVTRNMITVPLKTMSGQTIGLMQVLNHRHGNFDEADLEVLEILSAQAASAIDTARLHAQARLAVIVNLIGDISHDVKNLVTPVVTGTQTLEMMMQGMFEDLDRVLAGVNGPPSEEDIRDACAAVRDFYPEAMEMVYEGAQAAQDRVREIADAIKGEVAEPHFEPTRIGDVVDSVVKPLRFLAERSHVTLVTDGADGVPEAEIDRKRMYNAVYNLINNAIPETPAGGKITVATSLVNGGDTEPQLQIVIADTGRGMPPHIRERMFTDHVVSTKAGGTGLGTRIVKNVVDIHHGTIRVDSEPDKGTAFTIRIPLRQPQPTTQGAAI